LADVKKEVERLLDANFIRPCGYAEWISNIVPVYKKNGKMRVCIDFRDLNRATPMDGYPMPVADLLVDAAAGYKVISFMDGNAGYNQIFMAIEDISKTAFRCPGHIGLFEWIVEGPIRRTREGGSEWEPIKILLEGDENSNKTNTASNTRLRLTTQVGPARRHWSATGPRNQHTQPFDSRTQRTNKPRVYRPTPVRPVSTTGQTGPC
jgi:hypothetical protein